MQVGRKFSYYEQLAGVLLLPFIGSAFIFLIALLVIMMRRRHRDAKALGALLVSPTSCSLHIWMLLLFYPMLCRDALGPLNCVDVRGYYFLRSDQSEECNSATWSAWVVLSIIFILLYCAGIPVGLWWASSQQFKPARAEWWRPRVSLLRASYTDQFWWFESLDLLRKFALASLVVHVAPTTPV